MFTSLLKWRHWQESIKFIRWQRSSITKIQTRLINKKNPNAKKWIKITFIIITDLILHFLEQKQIDEKMETLK